MVPGRQEARTGRRGASGRGSADLWPASPAPPLPRSTNGAALTSCQGLLVVHQAGAPTPGLGSPALQYRVTEPLQDASTKPGGLGAPAPHPSQRLASGHPRGPQLCLPDCRPQETARNGGQQRPVDSSDTGEGGARQPRAPRPPAEAETQGNQVKGAWLLSSPVPASLAPALAHTLGQHRGRWPHNDRPPSHL